MGKRLRFHFQVDFIADSATDGNTVRLPPVRFQPMAAADVASEVGKVAQGTPVNGTVEVAGPDRFRLDEFIRQSLTARNDPREVIAETQARYFGAKLGKGTLIPGDAARLGQMRFEDWLRRSTPQTPATNPEPAVAAAMIEPAALKDNEFRVSEVPPGSALLVGNVAVFNGAGSFCATQDTRRASSEIMILLSLVRSTGGVPMGAIYRCDTFRQSHK